MLITGAGSGLGRLLALKFVHLGAIVVLWDINQESLDETCRLAKEYGFSRVHAYICDCSKRHEICKVAEQAAIISAFPPEITSHEISSQDTVPCALGQHVKKEVGDVTILINNARVLTGKLFLETSDDHVEKSFLVNTFPHIWTYKAFFPAMIAFNHGHLVCISSAAGLIGLNGLGDYCASKFASFGFAESIYFELRKLKKHGIQTTIVCPYFIKTGMFEGCSTKYPAVLPLLKPELVANKIVSAILEAQVYLITPKMAYIAVLLKHMISTKMSLALGDFLGAFNCMDTFQGRGETDKV